MQESEAVRVAAAVIVRDGRLLVCRRARGERLEGCWEFPGGKLEAGESPQQCIERELMEELGVESRAGAVVASVRYRYEHAEIELIGLRVELLSGLEDEGGPLFRLSAHDDCAWTAPDALLRLELAPADVPLAEKIILSGILSE